MKLEDFQHEGWCDCMNNISNSCNCIVGYPLEVIENLEAELTEIADMFLTTGYTEEKDKRVFNSNEYMWLDVVAEKLRKYKTKKPAR